MVEQSLRALAMGAALLTTTTLSILGSGGALAQNPNRGGWLSFAVVAEPLSYDCHASTSFALIHPVAPQYSLLVKFDGKDYPKVVPDLAESWSISSDMMTYTFKIRSGVRFHDGSPLTSDDIKASYDRIINPPAGVSSVRKADYANFLVAAPDPYTVVFKLKQPMAGVMQALASPFNCIYSAAKLRENPSYPATQIMGTGAFSFLKHVAGSSWSGKRFAGYFDKDKPYLDGFTAYFVKSSAVVPGMLGGQFDAEFRGRDPDERTQLLDRMKDKLSVYEGVWLSNLMIVFNTTRKPFDDVHVRQALSMAIDRWGGAQTLSKFSILKYVGGVMRPGYHMALPEAELVTLPGFARDINTSRAEARQRLKEAGQETLKFKLLNRNVADPFTVGALYCIEQWRRVGVLVDHELLETKPFQDRFDAGDFDVAIEFQADFADDASAQFSKYVTRALSTSGHAGHTDAKIDRLYEQQRHTLDEAERSKIVSEMERYALTQAYTVPLLWWQRIIVNHKKINGWFMTPSHYLWQDLSTVWLDQ
jgi:peptide/nickel transport system substrate-binding protein